ncbi:MAG TPA: ATP-binding protein [Planctomycetota bacterium]|nr:ATP-binding protein [Planctomycetota bacterium]
MRRPLGLGTRLALAFGGLFLAVSLITAGLAAWRAGLAAEALYRGRMASLVQSIPPSFVSNPDILARTKALVGAEVASVRGLSAGGGGSAPLIDTTLPEAERAELQRHLSAYGRSPRPEPRLDGPLTLAGRRFQVFSAWRSDPPLDAEAAGGRSVPRLTLLLVPQAEIDRVRRAAAAPIGWTALAGALAAVFLGFLLARTVARPLGELAGEAGRAAGGELAFRAAPGGGREVEELGESLERMSAALVAAREELVRSERMAVAGQMAAAMAHEVRNPLTSAKMVVEMELADEKRPEAAERLRAVLEELARLELVVDEMVSFARPAPPVFARVELPALVEEVLAFMRRQLEHAHVVARTEFDPAAGAARADRNKVKQVLVNLVLNAMQAQPRGGEIVVRIRPAAGGGGRLLLEVSDSGPGIRPEEVEKIFAPFYTTKSGGAGLGLAVSRRIAEEHGGSLSCDGGGAATGRGATFRVELPGWGAPAS